MLVVITGFASSSGALFSAYSLSGEGISSSLVWNTEEDEIWQRFNLANTTNISAYVGPLSKPLDSNIEVWNSTNNTATLTFDILQRSGGFPSPNIGFIPSGAQIHYAVQYSYDSNQINTAFGNTVIESVWQWDLYSSESLANGGTAGTDWTVTNLRAGTFDISPNTQFNIDLGTNVDFTDSFWDTNRSWEIFTNGTITNGANFLLNLQGDGLTSYNSAGGSSIGYFSFNGSNTMNWTAVPEPSTALAGLLLTAGLLRRRRSTPKLASL